MTPPTQEWPMPVWHLGKKVLVYDSVPSTNDVATALAPNREDSDGLVVFAREQTAGRGQIGKSWHSPADTGVYLSAILSPPEGFRRPAMLTALAGVAIAELVQALIKKPATIKWPNDVLVDGKKICGLLIEQGQYTIIGVGLNVNQSAAEFTAAGLPDATSLSTLSGEPMEVDHVARNVVMYLDREYRDLMLGRIMELESRWKAHLGVMDGPVDVELINGRTVRGEFREFGFNRIVLSEPQGTHMRMMAEQIRHVTRASN